MFRLYAVGATVGAALIVAAAPSGASDPVCYQGTAYFQTTVRIVPAQVPVRMTSPYPDEIEVVPLHGGAFPGQGVVKIVLEREGAC